ncbi:hypothetical protein GOP47_0006154 [Adiantum capillus-veneris]|uniref:Uncharacterized protein n=1 Tax=Adiantum capillus-veneris TaxID=13818 RepID=A0A9D4V3B3_ADICA|nr:hypothetical protein GOP47_0006154 [Adiantum capillus-veneris]
MWFGQPYPAGFYLNRGCVWFILTYPKGLCCGYGATQHGAEVEATSSDRVWKRRKICRQHEAAEGSCNVWGRNHSHAELW